MQRRNFIRTTLATLLLAASAATSAQTYPARPITMIIPFPPGGTLDAVGRMLAQKLGQQMGQSFVVENRPGGLGTIGGNAVKHAQPDGYTLLFAPSTHTSTPMAMKSPPTIRSKTSHRWPWWPRRRWRSPSTRACRSPTSRV